MGEKRIIRTVVEYEPLTEEELFSEEEQIEECCEEVSVDECADVGRKVSPYVSYDEEELDIDVDALTAEMEEQYGDKSLGVKLIAVGPTGNCGEKIETWEGRNDCCDEVAELAIDWGNSVDVLEPGTQGIVTFTGGKLPVFVKIRGNGFSLDGYNTREAWAYSRSFYVYAHEFACGSGPITLDDGCSVAQGSVRATVGQWDGLCIVWSIDGEEPQNISGTYRRLTETGDCGTVTAYEQVINGPQIYVRQDYSSAYEWDGSNWQQWWRQVQGNLHRDELDAWVAARLAEGWPQGEGPYSYAPNGPGDAYDLGYPVCSPDGSCRWIC